MKKRDPPNYLQSRMIKFRAYTTKKDKSKKKEGSQAIPETPVREAFPYHQPFKLGPNTFDFQSLDPEQLLNESIYNMPVNPALNIFNPMMQLYQQPISQDTQFQDTQNVESFQDLLTNFDYTQYPINEPIEPIMEDFTKRMEELRVDHTNEQRQHSVHPNGTPKRIPSIPNPPQLRTPNAPRYIRASDDFICFFSMLDQNNDGSISFDELKACLKNRDLSNYTNFSDETINMLIETFDDDNDKHINIKEFPGLAAFLGNWGRCFTSLDLDKSGTIDYKEMHYAMEELGINLGADFMIKLIQKYNRNGNTVIDFDNFILACVTLCRFKESYDFMLQNCGSASSHIQLEEFLRSTVLSPSPSQNA